MNNKLYLFILVILSQLFITNKSHAQPDQNVLDAIIHEVKNNSQLEQLGKELMDEIGPRLTGSTQSDEAYEWLVSRYNNWGITAYLEPYGKWKGWERGFTHLDMLVPRTFTLEARQLAWSPTSGSQPIIADVIAMPMNLDSIGFVNWLPRVKGKLVLISKPEISGRPMTSWEANATKDDVEMIKKKTEEHNKKWNDYLKKIGQTTKTLPSTMEKAGAAAVLSSYWSGGWGVSRIFMARTKKIPNIDIRMEDYNLLYRLLQEGVVPKLRLVATSTHKGDVVVSNGIAVIKGKEKPDEVVMLSAHFDSWDGGTGATDNGTGTILMMEVMRILKKVYPNPKRTIMVGHWNSEEQGLNGSKAFFEDHPELADKISLVLNQDNGTGRITSLNGQGFLDAYKYFQKWFSYIPNEITSEIKTTFPGAPDRGSSDHATFVQNGIPSFFPLSSSWDYGEYTWHSQYDTYDKINFEDVRRNAILYATLVYLACEEPEMFSRRKAVLPWNKEQNKHGEWPEYKSAARNYDY